MATYLNEAFTFKPTNVVSLKLRFCYIWLTMGVVLKQYSRLYNSLRHVEWPSEGYQHYTPWTAFYIFRLIANLC